MGGHVGECMVGSMRIGAELLPLAGTGQGLHTLWPKAGRRLEVAYYTKLLLLGRHHIPTQSNSQAK